MKLIVRCPKCNKRLFDIPKHLNGELITICHRRMCKSVLKIAFSKTGNLIDIKYEAV
jgi:hypothetical protein